MMELLPVLHSHTHVRWPRVSVWNRSWHRFLLPELISGQECRVYIPNLRLPAKDASRVNDEGSGSSVFQELMMDF